MADMQLTSEKNGLHIGVITAAVMIGYTAIAALAGFLDKVEAGTLNVVILAVGVVLAIKRIKAARGRHLTYFQGYGTGIITALTASVLLGAFFWLLGGISHRAVEQIQARNLFGADLGVLISGLGIILLGTMTGVITSLIAMQYFKSNEHESLVNLE